MIASIMEKSMKKKIVMATICDYAAQVRGKGYVTSDSSVAPIDGVGLAPTNLMINAFGQIVNSPWGSRGDLLMMPDMSTMVNLKWSEESTTEHFVLCDLQKLDGSAWECCPRDWLRRGLDVLENEFGLKLKSAFEHEFHYDGAEARLGNAYGLDAMRLQGEFAQTLIEALDYNNIDPEAFMPEYGEQQYEIVCGASIGIESADRAVRLREIVRGVARHYESKATFAPVMGIGKVGNGVHIHYSLLDVDGRPHSYDPAKPHNITDSLASFTAGILNSMPDFLALTAPAVTSYERLKPYSWSATHNNISNQDREASIRVSPLPIIEGIDPHKRFNLEYRAADATANPYLALGALVWAGIDGLRKNLTLPKLTDSDPNSMSEEELDIFGITRLPLNLDEALERLEKSKKMKEWMGEEFHQAYMMHRRGEMKLLEGLDDDEIVSRYVQCY